METETLVKASAQIITIHTLKKDDVYRRLEVSSYSPDKVVYGVVTDIGHNGEDAFISSLEFDPQDAAADIKAKTFGTKTDLALFNCTPEEFIAAAADVRVKQTRAITNKEAELDKARAALVNLEAMVSASNKLTGPEIAVPAEA